MKKLVFLIIVGLMLAGCSEPVYETLGEVQHVSATQPQLRQTVLALPEDAAMLTASGGDMLYSCDGYTMSLQSLPAGDLTTTVRTLSGYEPAQLTILETLCDDHTRYEWVWTSAGETGDVVCRGAVLDDGNYHYCLTVSADAEKAGALNQVWTDLFRSFCLEN